MKILKTAAYILFLLSIIHYPLSLGYAEPAVQTSEYRIGSENVLQIDVYYGRDMNLERKVRVSSKGYINFPLLGEVEVKGLTIAELESKIKYLLEKDYIVNPQVSVFIEEYSTVSILGQVQKPGTYELKGRMSVVELISEAGGFTKIASFNGVRIIRTDPNGSKETIKVKVDDIINKGKEENDVQLKAGDIVTVSESFF
ncbi:MAG: polysaccharide biosynthesis/export family protein [Candidatus Omnitrophota bacterium]